MNLEDVGVLLIPLEWVNSWWYTWLKAILYVVVYSQICLDEIGEVLDDLISIFIKESLQFRDILKLIKVFFKFSIEIQENSVVLIKDLHKFFIADLVWEACCLLQLSIFLTETIIKVRNLGFVIFFKWGLLFLDNFINLINELIFIHINGLLALRKYLTH
jgi:hypothetical protein